MAFNIILPVTDLSNRSYRDVIQHLTISVFHVVHSFM